MADGFEFDSGLQSLIAALVIRDWEFNSRCEGLIDPAHFSNSIEGGLVSLWQAYYNKYKRVPTSSAIASSLLKTGFKKRILRDSDKAEVLEKYKALWKLKIDDREYVIEQVSNFAKHQAMAKAILESVDLIEKGDYEKIQKLMKAADEVGSQDVFQTYNYFDLAKERKQHREDVASGKIPFDGITTGVELLDCHLKARGWGRKELSVIMGGPKSGKTTALIDFAQGASAAGHSVLYVTLEVSAEIVADRLDANLAEITYGLLLLEASTVERRIEALKATSGPIIINEFPSGSMTPAGLHRLIGQYKAQGVTFDLVVVDYADLMSPTHRSNESRENSRLIYVDLRAIAQSENCALLTATQSNREGMKAAVQKMEHVSDDINKVRTADLVLTINQTEDERMNKQVRLYFAASRNQEDGICIRIGQALERGKFIAKVIGKEMA